MDSWRGIWEGAVGSLLELRLRIPTRRWHWRCSWFHLCNRLSLFCIQAWEILRVSIKNRTSKTLIPFNNDFRNSTHLWLTKKKQDVKEIEYLPATQKVGQIIAVGINILGFRHFFDKKKWSLLVLLCSRDCCVGCVKRGVGIGLPPAGRVDNYPLGNHTQGPGPWARARWVWYSTWAVNLRESQKSQ